MNLYIKIGYKLFEVSEVSIGMMYEHPGMTDKEINFYQN